MFNMNAMLTFTLNVVNMNKNKEQRYLIEFI